MGASRRLPLAGFPTFDDEAEQYLFCHVLRAGNAAAKQGAVGVPRRLLPRLRRAFPGARLRIRLDSGFSGPELFEFFEGTGSSMWWAWRGTRNFGGRIVVHLPAGAAIIANTRSRCGDCLGAMRRSRRSLHSVPSTAAT